MRVRVNRRRAVAAALTTIAVLGLAIVGLTGYATADDGGPRVPQGGWPKPTPTTVTITRTQPAETVTQPAETVTETITQTTTATRTRTATKTAPPPVWTEPNLPVTGARPAVVGVATGGGVLLIAGGVALLWYTRRRRDTTATRVG